MIFSSTGSPDNHLNEECNNQTAPHPVDPPFERPLYPPFDFFASPLEEDPPSLPSPLSPRFSLFDDQEFINSFTLPGSPPNSLSDSANFNALNHQFDDNDASSHSLVQTDLSSGSDPLKEHSSCQINLNSSLPSSIFETEKLNDQNQESCRWQPDKWREFLDLYLDLTISAGWGFEGIFNRLKSSPEYQASKDDLLNPLLPRSEQIKNLMSLIRVKKIQLKKLKSKPFCHPFPHRLGEGEVKCLDMIKKRAFSTGVSCNSHFIEAIFRKNLELLQKKDLTGEMDK